MHQAGKHSGRVKKEEEDEEKNTNIMYKLYIYINVQNATISGGRITHSVCASVCHHSNDKEYKTTQAQNYLLL